MNKIRISDAELEIMQIIWEQNRSVTFREICDWSKKDVKKVTMQTLVSRLVEKGVLRQEKREVYYYSPLVTSREYEQSKTDELIQRVYRGDVKKLFSAILDSKAISKQDLEELQHFWKEANNDE